MSVQRGSTQAQGTGRGEGCGRGEEEQSQQLEETCGQQHVATVDQHRHGQHHVGQQPAEECHPGEPGPGEGWYLCLIWGELLAGGLRWRLGDPRTPKEVRWGFLPVGFPTKYCDHRHKTVSLAIST